MQIAVELPKELIEFEGEEQLQHEVQLSYALWLYQEGRVSLSKAAQLSGMDLYDFLTMCKKHKIPAIDISKAELVKETGA